MEVFFVFFLAVACAAITSLVNLFETPIEALQEQLHLPRWGAVLIVAVVAFGVGVFIESGDAVSAWMDAVSIYAIPLGALLAAIMFFWVCPKHFAKEQAQTGRGKKIGAWFEPMTKYLFVGITAVVIVLGIFYGGIGEARRPASQVHARGDGLQAVALFCKAAALRPFPLPFEPRIGIALRFDPRARPTSAYAG